MEITRITSTSIEQKPQKEGNKQLKKQPQNIELPDRSVEVTLPDTSINVSIDTAKIEALKAKIGSGDYTLDFKAIATAVVNLNDE